MSVLAWRVAGLAVVAALIALWGEIAALKLISPVFLPTPARVWTALQHGFLHGGPRRETGRYGQSHVGRLGDGLDRRRRPRRPDRVVEIGARVHRADPRVLAAPARLGRHSSGDRDLRPDAADGARRHRLRLDLAGAARGDPRLRRDRTAAGRGRASPWPHALAGDHEHLAAVGQPRIFSPGSGSASRCR